MSDHAAHIDDALGRLRRAAGTPAAAAALRARAPRVAEDMVAAITARVGTLDDAAELERQANALLDDYLGLLDGGRPAPPTFVEDFARDAAERRQPLQALLLAYRVGLRHLLRATNDALLAAAPRDAVGVVAAATDLALEYMDAIVAAATGHYLDQSRLLADVASEQRGALLAMLLDGYDESDRRATALLRDAGYLDRRLTFCVVMAQSIDPSEMHHPARARRLADHIDRLLAHIPGERLVATRDHKATLVFSHRQRLSGWSPPRASLAARIAAELLKIGPAARIGVSNEVDAIARIPAAHRQAALAFAASSIGQRVVRFADIPLRRLLRDLAGDEFTRLLPPWADAYRAADARAGGRLSATLRAYADNDMNLLRAARALGVHANTVYARFDRIAALCDRDPRGFAALNDLLIVADADPAAAKS